MANIIWLGEKYFSHRLTECGWDRVFAHKPAPYDVFTYEDLVKLAGFIPDVVVAADFSSPPTLPGVENFPCLTVFYSIDSHIHSWHPVYSQAFDACLHSLKDHHAAFERAWLPSDRVWWSPAFAKDSDYPDFHAKKEYKSVFVGTDNSELAPKRHNFLKKLSELQPDFYVTRGKYRDIYNKSHVIVNQAEHDDLNFRVFEAMGCGGALVTPLIGHGLEELFINGRHFLGYESGNAGDASAKINRLLEDSKLCQAIAQAGYEEVNARHRAVHRAQAFTRNMEKLFKSNMGKDIVLARLSRAKEMRDKLLSMFYLSFAAELDEPRFKSAFFKASKGIM